MAIQLFAKHEKPWFIHLRRIEDFVIAEISNPLTMWRDYRTVYIDLLDHILQDYKIVALSQTIDERQWGEEILDRKKYMGAISKRFSVQAMITTDYDKPDSPDQTSHSFVMHVVGHPNRPLLHYLLEFGMTALPNIMYGLKGIPEPWPLQVLSWNRVFLRWFRLEETDTALTKLIGQAGLVLWTADRRLSFGLSQASEVERILLYIEGLAQEWSQRLAVEWDH